jgi:mannan endo-1,4-beta-mannosidase
VTEWNLPSGEPKQSILDPNSKTAQATSRYIREFVTRYKDDPTVLMWELQNELMLAADVDMLGVDLLPKGVYPPGATVREKGQREDSLTWAMIQQIYRQQTALIKKLDPNHLVTSGDAQTRPEATSRRETFPDFKFREDTWREFVANNLAAQPEPLDVYSLHHYGTFDASGEWPKSSGLTSLDRFRLLARAVQSTRTPLFIGELGQEQPSFKDDPEAKWTQAYIDMAEREGISLMALWVWHFPWQPDRTLSSQTHPLLVQRVAAFNRLHAGINEGTGH